MKITKFDFEDEWLESRWGKITGSRLKDLVVLRGTGEKIGFYELIAEKLAKPKTSENSMERGRKLEVEAIEILEKKLSTNFIKDLVLWEREDNKNIAISPDAYSEDLREAVEVKCLNSAAHIKSFIEEEYPDDYKFQVYQYFIVNDKLVNLHFVMYDPRLSVKDHFYFTINRKDIEEEIDKYLEYQEKKLEMVNQYVKELSF